MLGEREMEYMIWENSEASKAVNGLEMHGLKLARRMENDNKRALFWYKYK